MQNEIILKKLHFSLDIDAEPTFYYTQIDIYLFNKNNNLCVWLTLQLFVFFTTIAPPLVINYRNVGFLLTKYDK